MRLLAKEQRVARAEGWVPPDEGAALQAAVEARERQVEVAALHRDMLRAQVKDLEAAVGALLPRVNATHVVGWSSTNHWKSQTPLIVNHR